MLNEKIAVITGASRGIGAAIAKKMAENGATVIINYQGSVQAAQALEAEIIEKGGKAVTYKCDVSDFDKCEKFIGDIVKEYGRIDILVNNAGITRDGLLMGMKEEDFDSVINVNLKGTFNTIRFASRTMVKQRKGKIINISSVSGVTGNAGQANYSASKAGIIGLTKSAARELASRNINVNAIAPGFVDTDMTITLSDKVKEGAKGQIPLGRFGKPEEVAELALFLSSEKSDYITGQVINHRWRNGNVIIGDRLMERRVVVTGRGAITPIGNNCRNFLEQR